MFQTGYTASPKGTSVSPSSQPISPNSLHSPGRRISVSSVNNRESHGSPWGSVAPDGERVTGKGFPSSPRAPGLVQGGTVFMDSWNVNAARTSVCAACAAWIVDNNFVIAFTSLCTMFALISDDIRIMLTEAPFDPTYNAFTIILFSIFTVEVTLCCIGQQDYFNSFFFYMDCLSTLSLAFDITNVSDWLTISLQGNDDYSSAAVIGARATRAVRVLRLVRILKLQKAFLQQRKKKKMPADDEKNDDWDDEDEVQDETAPEPVVESGLGKKLSQRTTQKCVFLVLAMMLIYPLLSADEVIRKSSSDQYGTDLVYDRFMLYQADPAMRWWFEDALLRMIYHHSWFGERTDACLNNADSCPAEHDQHVFWFGVCEGEAAGIDSPAILKEKANVSHIEPGFYSLWQSWMAPDAVYNYGSFPLEAQKILVQPLTRNCKSLSGKLEVGLSLSTPETADGKHVALCPEDLRLGERRKISPRVMTDGAFRDWHFCFFLDQRRKVKIGAQMNCLRTVFLCALLCGASLVFAHDARVLVLQPVETMIMKVQLISKNPLIAAKLTAAAFKAEEIARSKERKAKEEMRHHRSLAMVKKVWSFILCNRHEGINNSNETLILEKTIMKLGALLALGFGEAGVNVIAHNMRGADTAGVDAMVPGTLLDCIIGSARMRNFSIFTEVLQGKVMTFVNQVAEVLHSVVDDYHGSPSRNSGDSFLVAWPLRKENKAAKAWEALYGTDGNFQFACSRMADMSVLAFALVLSSINRSAVLASYRSHPGLQQRLGRRLRVSVTFGLHLGWAIEGALGSEFKIDATYVSPNVGIAEQVERAAEVYGTSILATEALWERLTPNMQHKLRLIDRVKIRGSSTPMALFVVDVNHIKLTIEEPVAGIRWNTRQRFRAKQFLEEEKERRLDPNLDIASVFEQHPDLELMSAPYSVTFREVFNMGFHNYVEGEWKTAQRLLSRTLMQLSFEDGPSAALIRFMQQWNFVAPEKWTGVHPLEDMPASTNRNVLVPHRPVWGSKDV